jgi:hypothetical protein
VYVAVVNFGIGFEEIGAHSPMVLSVDGAVVFLEFSGIGGSVGISVGGVVLSFTGEPLR